MKMKRTKTLLFITIIISLATTQLLAQNQQELERGYFETLASIKLKQTGLDSLNIQLTNLASTIDDAKKANDSEPENVRILMAQALSISNEIQAQRNLILELQNQLEEYQRDLDDLYIAETGSIQSLLQSKDFTGDKESLNTKMHELAQKRMMISPLVQSFTFDPQKVNSIQSVRSDDLLEQEMLKDYLNNAMAEITEKLAELRNTKDELEDIVLLEEKTEDFLADIDPEGFVGFTTSSAQSNASARATDLTGAESFSDPAKNISLQIQAYVVLVNQLELSTLSTQNLDLPLEPGSKTSTFTNKEYLKIVEEVERQLKEYQTIISKKLVEN